MRKIPTVFVRDPDDRKHVLNEVTPGCEWVLAGEGQATRKYDGTCVLIERDGLAIKAWTRREVKPGKTPPPRFRESDHDEVTGKTVGWEPSEQSGFSAFVDEAFDAIGFVGEPGTYELCGPSVNGNPEGYEKHRLVKHSAAMKIEVERSFDGIRSAMLDPDWPDWEGIVFHHPDGRMAKIKVRDFR